MVDGGQCGLDSTCQYMTRCRVCSATSVPPTASCQHGWQKWTSQASLWNQVSNLSSDHVSPTTVHILRERLTLRWYRFRIIKVWWWSTEIISFWDLKKNTDFHTEQILCSSFMMLPSLPPRLQSSPVMFSFLALASFLYVLGPFGLWLSGPLLLLLSLHIVSILPYSHLPSPGTCLPIVGHLHHLLSR